jgi:hypothetical protein
MDVVTLYECNFTSLHFCLPLHNPVLYTTGLLLYLTMQVNCDRWCAFVLARIPAFVLARITCSTSLSHLLVMGHRMLHLMGMHLRLTTASASEPRGVGR